MPESKEPRWLRINTRDMVCLFYWGAIFVSLCILFDWPIDFRSSLMLTNWPRRITGLFGFWCGTTLSIQAVGGYRSLGKSIWRFVTFPATLMQICTGFLWHSKAVASNIKKQFPAKSFLFLGLSSVTVLGFTESNTDVLNFLLPISWITLLLVIYFCFRWAFNPIPAFEILENSYFIKGLQKIRTWVVGALSKVETADAETASSKLADKLDTLRKFTEAIPKVLGLVRGPKLLFVIFSAIFTFGAVSTVILIGVILRIKHLTTPGGVFEGQFFSGATQDYLYISLNHFFGQEMYNISIISIDARFILSALPIIMMFIAVLLITAFTMVGQSRVDTMFQDFGKSMLAIIDEATKNISDKREVILIDQRKSKPNEIAAPIPKTSEPMLSVGVNLKSPSE